VHDDSRDSNLIVLSEFAAAFCSAKSIKVAVAFAVAAINPFWPFRFAIVMLDAPYKSPVCLIVKDVPVVEILKAVPLLVISPNVAREMPFIEPDCEIEAVVVTPFL
jgi:hypothetical protein